MLLREYRIAMPLSVEEYRIGQLYMIAKHSHEQSGDGEGVQVVVNEPCTDEVHGNGQFTEKIIYLSSRLPNWIKMFIPNIFYITEKAWNFYPFTKTEYTCSFLSRFHIYIETRFENNAGTSDNCLELSDEDWLAREVVHLDIVTDPVGDKHYKESEDLTKFHSEKTGRGPYTKGWKETADPVMCSYKAVKVKFEVWGMQTRVEDWVQQAVSSVLLLGHRQAVAWIDEWYGKTIDDVREYETKMHEETNSKMAGTAASALSTDEQPTELNLQVAEASS